jgi:cytochrome d ubiquinol oxidase subunit I
MDPVASAEALLLARIQFAANISFHILFPTITIALGWVLLYLRLQATRTGEPRFLDAYRLWVKVFALSFALGVVSGVTMSFQFGTNWPGFMERVGNVAGPLLAYEVLTAFFLEATFLAVMLFGIGRVSTLLHTLATFLVAFGTTMSAFWIIVLNSWMHTPQGFEMRANASGVMVAHVTDWLEVIFTPSMPYRLTHMLLASFLTVAFLMAGIAAFQWLRGTRGVGTMTSLRTGVTLAALVIPLQILAGDLHGINTMEYQPAKVAAMEGIWQTESPAALRLFAWPDQAAGENRWSLEIPHLASLILTHSWDGEVKGLAEFAPNIPPVAPVFFAFRIMVGVGVLMLVVSWWAFWTLRKRGEPSLWVARALVGMTFAGWVATLAGWYVTEIGRQPWLVTGVLTTSQAAGPVPAGAIGASLALYLVLYGVLLVAYIATLFHLARSDKAGVKPDVKAPQTMGQAVAAAQASG